jgi:arabinofuranosyltransferase
MLHRQLNNLALRPYPILLLILGMALTELFLSAWLSDDALITVRSVLNLISGYGPSFNLDERVQSFTHPLWFLLL